MPYDIFVILPTPKFSSFPFFPVDICLSIMLDFTECLCAGVWGRGVKRNHKIILKWFSGSFSTFIILLFLLPLHFPKASWNIKCTVIYRHIQSEAHGIFNPPHLVLKAWCCTSPVLMEFSCLLLYYNWTTLLLLTFHGCASFFFFSKTLWLLLMINSGFCLSLAVGRFTKGSSGHVMPNYKQVPAPRAGIPHYKQAWLRCFCVSLCCVYDRTWQMCLTLPFHLIFTGWKYTGCE